MEIKFSEINKKAKFAKKNSPLRLAHLKQDRLKYANTTGEMLPLRFTQRSCMFINKSAKHRHNNDNNKHHKKHIFDGFANEKKKR